MADGVNIRMSFVGSEQIAASLRQLGPIGRDSFNQIKQSVEQTVAPLRQLGDALSKIKGTSISEALDATGLKAPLDNLVSSGSKAQEVLRGIQQQAQQTAQAVKQIGIAQGDTAGETQRHASSLSSLSKGLIAIGGVAFAAGASMYAAGKKAGESIKAMVDAAEEFGGQDLDKYQQAKYVLEQLGMASDEAQRAIQTFTENSQKNVGKLSEQLQKLGFRFAPTEAGAKAAGQMIEQMGGAMAKTIPQAERLSKLGFRFAPGDDVVKTIASLAKLGDTAQSAWARLKEGTPDVVEGIKSVADAVKLLGDEAAAKKVLVANFGDEAGEKLYDKIKRGKVSVEELLLDFQRIGRGGITDAMKEAAADYDTAMKRMTTATANARNQIGAVFLPVITRAIVAFTNVMADSHNVMNSWAEKASESFRAVGEDIANLVQGNEALNFPWLNTAAGLIEEFGSGVKEVFDGVVKPAFAGLVKLIDPVTSALNSMFGTQFSAGAVAVGAALTYLTGGFKSLTVAALAFFGLMDDSDISLPQNAQLIQFLGDAKDGFVDLSADAKKSADSVSSLREAFGRAWVSAKQFFSDLAASLGRIDFAQALTSGLNVVARAFDYLGAKVKSVKDFFGTWTGWATMATGATLAGGAILYFTGLMDPLLTTLHLVQTVIGTLSSTVLLLGVSIGTAGSALHLLMTVGSLLGPFLSLTAILAIMVTNFDHFVSVCDKVAAVLNRMFGVEFFTGMGIALVGLAGVSAALIVMSANAILGSGAIGLLAGAFTLLAKHPIVAKMLVLAAVLESITGIGKKAALSFGEQIKGWAELDEKAKELQKQAEAAKNELAGVGQAQPGTGVIAQLQGIMQQLGLTKDQTDGVNKSLGELLKNWGNVGKQKIPTASLDDVKKAIQGVGSEAEAARAKLAKLGMRVVPPSIEELQTGIKKAGDEADRLRQKMSQDFGFRWVAPAKAAAEDVKKTADAVAETGPKIALVADSISDVGDSADEAGPRMTDLFGQIPKDADKAETNVKSLREAIDGFLKRPTSISSFKQLFSEMLPSVDVFENTKREFKALFDWLAEAKKNASFVSPAGAAEFVQPPKTEGIEEGLKAIGDRVGKVLADSVKIALEELPKVIAKGFQDALPDVRSVIEEINKMIEDMVRKAALAWEALSRMREGVGTEGQPNLQQANLRTGGPVAPAAPAAGAASTAQIVAPFEDAAGQIKAIWDAIAAIFADTSQISAALTVIPEIIAAPFRQASEMVKNEMQSLTNAVQGMVTQIDQMLTALMNRINSAKQAAAQANSSSPGFAGGGLFRGIGGIDKNLAWLSDWEYIFSPRAVRYWGVGFLDALNYSLKLPSVRGFAMGGLNATISSAVPSPSSISSSLLVPQQAGQMRTLQLVIGGKKLDTTGPAKVIETIEREVTLRGLASLGIAPSFVR